MVNINRTKDIVIGHIRYVQWKKEVDADFNAESLNAMTEKEILQLEEILRQALDDIRPLLQIMKDIPLRYYRLRKVSEYNKENNKRYLFR